MRSILAASSPIRFVWQDVDRHRLLLPIALLGLVVGQGLAVFGLPHADLHGPLHRFGVMDPLCGGTRGLRLMMRGEVDAAWRYNPAAVLLPPTAILALVRDAVGRVSGRWADVAIVRRRALLVAAALALLALEIHQQSHRALLIAA